MDKGSDNNLWQASNIHPSLLEDTRLLPEWFLNKLDIIYSELTVSLSRRFPLTKVCPGLILSTDLRAAWDQTIYLLFRSKLMGKCCLPLTKASLTSLTTTTLTNSLFSNLLKGTRIINSHSSKANRNCLIRSNQSNKSLSFLCRSSTLRVISTEMKRRTGVTSVSLLRAKNPAQSKSKPEQSLSGYPQTNKTYRTGARPTSLFLKQTWDLLTKCRLNIYPVFLLTVRLISEIGSLTPLVLSGWLVRNTSKN